MTTAGGDPLLTVREAIQITGTPRRTFWRWIEKGAIPVERTGPFRRPKVRWSVLRAFFPHLPEQPAS